MTLHPDVTSSTAIKKFATLEEELTVLHGNKYDYSSVVYTSSKVSVDIRCREHDVLFKQTIGNHTLGKKGCWKCSGKIAIDLPTFIEASERIQGKGLYDFSKVVYKNAKSKVILTCLEHDIEFSQSLGNHYQNKKGCYKCAGLSSVDTESFIEEATRVHGSVYDFSNSVYKDTHTNIEFICPVHGTVKAQPSNILQGQGCYQCGRDTTALKLKYTTNEFIAKAKEVHGDKYKYDKCTYGKGKEDEVTIYCNSHKEYFNQRASGHLMGRGCPKCGNEIHGLHSRSNTKEFIDKAVGVFGDLYDYSLVDYTTANDKISIICRHHGVFYKKPSKHLSGQGCTICSEGKGGFNSTLPALLYYLKVTSEEGIEVFKIGITNRTIQERFKTSDLEKIEILWTKKFEVGKDANDRETEIKRKYKEYQYKGPDILSNGNTELFIVDIRNLKEN